MKERNCEILLQYLEHIMYGSQFEKPDLAELETSCEKLGQKMEVLEDWVEEMLSYSENLSKGNLSGSGCSKENLLCRNLKDLHASLNRLTWQAKQIAAGDYVQEAVYLGELSDAFHAMVGHLKKRESQLKAEKEKVERQVDLVNSYNELLVELTRKQKEWILVVDAQDKDIVYCNKRNAEQEEVLDSDFCEICENKLPFRNKLLYWEDNEQGHTWEVSDGRHRYYRITTFPLEWKKRKAYAHILLDITDERLETRNLKNKAYHDRLTGVYNRIYFEEYMDKILRDKRKVVLGYLDLDCLKTVNDQFGHGEGDGYILRFIATVQKYFRTTDIFARIGGDEFCLILDNISREVAVEKLTCAMEEFQGYRDKEYTHGFSFGVTEIRGQAETRTLPEIIKEVDKAMYECKRKNKELYKSR